MDTRADLIFAINDEVKRVQRLVQQTGKRLRPDAPADYGERSYLRVIRDRQPMTLSQLAASRDVCKVQARRVVDHLVEIGFAAVTAGADGRSQEIFLTVRGREWIDQTDAKIKQWAAREITANMDVSVDELEIALRVLCTMRGAFESWLSREN
jgi:DNA-binding MarR family transcriptional regulator